MSQTNLSAQGYSNNWIFGANVSLDFSTNPPQYKYLEFVKNSGTIDPSYNIESSASVSNAEGKTLFYAVGQYLFNGFTNTLISSNLGTTLDASQGNLIVPKPGTNDQYLLFTIDASYCSDGQPGSSRGTRYYNIKVDEAAQTVSVSLPSSGTPLTAPSSYLNVIEGQAVCPTGTPEEYWYIVHGASGYMTPDGNFRLYKIKSNGVLYDHEQKIGPNFSNCSYINIKFNSCYTQVAVATSTELTLYNFDVSTGLLSSPSTYISDQIYGLEFSPNGKYLYTSSGADDKKIAPQLLKFSNVNNGILSSPIVMANLDATTTPQDVTPKSGHLQLGPDGNIYSVNKIDYTFNIRKNFIGVILHPDSDIAVYKPTYIEVTLPRLYSSLAAVGMGLPNFPKSLILNKESFYVNDINISKSNEVCQNKSVKITYQRAGSLSSSAIWTIEGNTFTTNFDTTGITSINYTFANSGATSISVDILDNCNTPVTISKTVNVNTTICNATGIADEILKSTIYVYPNPSNGQFTIQAAQEGIYSILNELGQTIQTIDLNTSNQYKINIENLAEGMYFIYGYNANHKVTQKILIKK